MDRCAPHLSPVADRLVVERAAITGGPTSLLPRSTLECDTDRSPGGGSHVAGGRDVFRGQPGELDRAEPRITPTPPRTDAEPLPPTKHAASEKARTATVTGRCQWIEAVSRAPCSDGTLRREPSERRVMAVSRSVGIARPREAWRVGRKTSRDRQGAVFRNHSSLPAASPWEAARADRAIVLPRDATASRFTPSGDTGRSPAWSRPTSGGPGRTSFDQDERERRRPRHGASCRRNPLLPALAHSSEPPRELNTERAVLRAIPPTKPVDHATLLGHSGLSTRSND